MNISEILNGTKMNDCITKKECICQKNNSVPKECINETTIEDSKKKVKIDLKNNSEKAIVVILDNCLITDNNTKCDALFLYQTKNRKMACLVELKGFGEIEKAFKQLYYTKQRSEYKEIIKCFKNIDNKKVYEKAFIVTNKILNKVEKENLENEYNIRVAKILESKPEDPIPDLDCK